MKDISKMKNNENGVIHSISGENVHRIMEMGFQKGQNIKIIQGGNPCIVNIDGMKNVCMRSDNNILVKEVS